MLHSSYLTKCLLLPLFRNNTGTFPVFNSEQIFSLTYVTTLNILRSIFIRKYQQTNLQTQRQISFCEWTRQNYKRAARGALHKITGQ
jgi:hypothetical protein